MESKLCITYLVYNVFTKFFTSDGKSLPRPRTCFPVLHVFQSIFQLSHSMETSSISAKVDLLTILSSLIFRPDSFCRQNNRGLLHWKQSSILRIMLKVSKVKFLSILV